MAEDDLIWRIMWMSEKEDSARGKKATVVMRDELRAGFKYDAIEHDAVHRIGYLDVSSRALNEAVAVYLSSLIRLKQGRSEYGHELSGHPCSHIFDLERVFGREPIEARYLCFHDERKTRRGEALVKAMEKLFGENAYGDWASQPTVAAAKEFFWGRMAEGGFASGRDVDWERLSKKVEVNPKGKELGTGYCVEMAAKAEEISVKQYVAEQKALQPYYDAEGDILSRLMEVSDLKGVWPLREEYADLVRKLDQKLYPRVALDVSEMLVNFNRLLKDLPDDEKEAQLVCENEFTFTWMKISGQLEGEE